MRILALDNLKPSPIAEKELDCFVAELSRERPGEGIFPLNPSERPICALMLASSSQNPQ